MHFLRFFKLLFLKVFGVYYYNPAVQKRRQKRQLGRLLASSYGWSVPAEGFDGMRVAVIARDGDSYPKSSAFIRLISPLTDPALKGKLTLQLYPENTRSVPANCDVCIVQRNAFDTLKGAESLVKALQATQTALVIDTDDAFHDIDPDHPEHDAHRATLAAFDYLVAHASQVWTSTDQLATYFKQANPNTTVVRNSLDQRVWHHHEQHEPGKDTPLQLLYMGTVSHSADFELIFPALDAAAEKNPGSFELTVIGVASTLPDRPWVKRIYQKRGGSIYPRFIPWLLKQGPFDYGLSPLVDNEFNRGKSDIKCLDYIGLGATPIVSDVLPYQNEELDDFIIRVKNSRQAWESAICEIISDTVSSRSVSSVMNNRAREYAFHSRSSSASAQQLFELLQDASGR